MRLPLPAAPLLALALVASSPGAIRACTCTEPPTLQQEFDGAWKVFSGRVVAIQPELDGLVAVIFEPYERWKGTLDYFVKVVTPEHEGVCGYPFAIGGEYLVFGQYHLVGITYTPTAFTHLCSRTSALEGNPYLAQLPPPLLPTPATARSWGTLKVRYR